MPLEKLVLTPNVPVQIALKFPDGKLCEGRFGNQVYFTLAQPPNTCLYLDLGPAEKVNRLEPAKGELFNICKRWTGKKTDSPVWDVWPISNGEARPAPPAPATVSPQSQLAADLIRSIEHVQAGASIPPPANSHTNGNGKTNGAPYAAAGIPAPPVKIPMNIAVTEIVRMVQQAMKDTGEQWSDNSRQDLASTLLIAAAKEGWITVWERAK